MSQEATDAGQDGARPRIGLAVLAMATFVGLLAALLFVCIISLPQILYPELTGKDFDEQRVPVGKDRIILGDARLKLQNDARTTLLQGLAALLVLTGASIGASVGLQQIRVSRQQLQATWHQLRQTETASLRQSKLMEEGNITERFTRAVDQLGHQEADVRIGAVYGLERLAKSSEGDQVPILEILSTFVRSHSPWPPSLPHQPDSNVDIRKGRTALRFYAPDIQAAMTALGRLDNRPRLPILDLYSVDLRGVVLLGARLYWSMFTASNLERALLSNADLSNSDLSSANLKYAILRGTNLRQAKLHGADLEGAEASSKTVWPTGFDPNAAGVNLRD